MAWVTFFQRRMHEHHIVHAAAVHLNLRHLRTAAGVMVILNVAHVLLFGAWYEAADALHRGWAQQVTHAHALLAVGMGLVCLWTSHGLRQPHRAGASAHLGVIVSAAVLAWAVWLTTIDQAVTSGIQPFYTACAAVAMVVRLRPLWAMVLFVWAWGLMASQLGALVSRDPAFWMHQQVNIGAAVVLALMVSLLLWRRFVQTELLQQALAQSNALLRQQQSELEALATTDVLTNVMNRRAFIQRTDFERLRARRDLTPLSLLMIDLDHFKQVNDHWGHPAGDAVLSHVAQLMRDAVRATDAVARWGGEEFVLLLPNTAQDAAVHLATQLRRHVMAAPLPWPPLSSQTESVSPVPGSNVIPVTVSIGLVCLPVGREIPLDELIALADQALYRAKHHGRNRVECAFVV